jgi:hypothetical protein
VFMLASPIDGSAREAWIAMMSSSWKREREKTPSGFARAFFEANP